MPVIAKIVTYFRYKRFSGQPIMYVYENVVQYIIIALYAANIHMKYYDKPFFTKFASGNPCYNNKSEYMHSIFVSIKEILESRVRLDVQSMDMYKDTRAFMFGIFEGLLYEGQQYIYNIHRHIKQSIMTFEPRINNIELVSFENIPHRQTIKTFFEGKTDIDNFKTDIEIKLV